MEVDITVADDGRAAVPSISSAPSLPVMASAMSNPIVLAHFAAPAARSVAFRIVDNPVPMNLMEVESVELLPQPAVSSVASSSAASPPDSNNNGDVERYLNNEADRKRFDELWQLKSSNNCYVTRAEYTELLQVSVMTGHDRSLYTDCFLLCDDAC